MSAVEYHSVSGLHKLNHSIRICSRKPRSEQPRSSYSRGWVTPGYSVRARLSRSVHSVSPNPTPAAGNRLIILGESISRRGYSRFRSKYSLFVLVRRASRALLDTHSHCMRTFWDGRLLPSARIDGIHRSRGPSSTPLWINACQGHVQEEKRRVAIVCTCACMFAFLCRCRRWPLAGGQA